MTAAALPRRSRRLRSAAPAPLRIALYLRISRDAKEDTDDEGEAVDRQEKRCRALVAGRSDWLVGSIEAYREKGSVSASKGKRPAWEKMLRDIEAGEIDVVVCYALDRLLRKPRELEELIDTCDATGCRVVSVLNDISLGDGDPAAETSARVFAAFAAQETKRKAQRQRDQQVQAAEKGRPPSRRAFGYKRGGMELEPAEAASVRDGYKWAGQGVALAEIARRWNAAGHLTTRGIPWEAYAVRGVLLNPRNAAIRTYLGEEVGPGTWPKIVSEETFRSVAALLRDPARMNSGGETARKWLLAGLAYCGVCAEQGVEQRVRSMYKDTRDKDPSKRRRQRGYTCDGPSGRHMNRVHGPEMDDFVERVIRTRLAEPDMPAALAADDPELGKLQDEEKAVRANLRRIESDYGDGDIPARVYKEQTARQEEKLERIQRRLAELTRDSRLASLLAEDDPVRAWDEDYDVPAKQEIIRALCTVTLLRGNPGRKGFDPATVRIDWR